MFVSTSASMAIKPDLSDRMTAYLRAIEQCNLLVFRRIQNQLITAGIGKEINHALEKQIKVLEITNGEFIPIEVKVECLTREETNLLFDKMRSMKEYKEYCGF